MSNRRLSICYVVPGHDLLSTVGPSRNVINLARALGEWADVTVAFRRVAEHRPEGLRVLEIQPGHVAATVDDASMKGVGYAEFFGYLRDVRSFAQRELPSFDIVLEKSWLLSGYVSSICNGRGQLVVPIENIVVNPAHAAGSSIMKRIRLEAGRWLAGRALRKAPLVIAETEFLKKEIVRFWGVSEERVAVVDLGVDRELFHPMEQSIARARVGISAQPAVILYVGVLDRTHDLEQVIRAMGGRKPAGVELHVVGEGARRIEYETLARECGAAAIFHGRVPHREVPVYISAADLCIAPYDAAAFSSGELGYSTMKIPEYLSVGRAVASVPSGRIRSLVAQGETGFLFPNEAGQWEAFLDALPGRERLREMGAAAARTRLTSWPDTARQYLSLCEARLAAAGGGGRAWTR